VSRRGQTVSMSEHSAKEGDHLSGPEIGKDVIQATAEAAASAVGKVAAIITRAVRDVATTIGDLATEIFEIGEASRKAAEDADLGAGPSEPV
jgi:hypothetical protein